MILKRIIPLLVCCILLNAPNVFSQLDNKILSTELPIEAKDTNKLFLSFNSMNFLRNTEYFGPIESGKTMFGYSLTPKLVYFPTSHIRIDLGGLFRKDYGNNEFKLIAPVFSVKISKNGFSGIFGNLEGGMSHQYIEPLYNIDYAIFKPLENGLQFKINKKHIWSDTYIDWQRMIYYGSPFKEEIMAGTSDVITLLGADKKFKIAIPLQAIVHHFGGQIDTMRATRLTSLYNTACGLRFIYLFNENSFFKELRSDNYFATYKDGSGVKKQAYKDGYGIYLNLLLRTKFLNVMASYWNGYQFISYNGTLIYQSINTTDPTLNYYREPSRQLFYLRLFYEKQLLKGLNLDVRFEPYYELTRKSVDFSYSIYLSYKLNVKVATIKPAFFEQE